jgi:hypothetical protein
VVVVLEFIFRYLFNPGYDRSSSYAVIRIRSVNNKTLLISQEDLGCLVEMTCAGFTNFRVITVTPNETRSENLRIASKEANTDKKRSNMFLFAADKNYSITKPETIFEPIWKSPKDDLPKTIL